MKDVKLDPTGCVDVYNGTGYFQVRNNWEGKGYRLYYGDNHTCSQVGGEINGKVYRTIRDAKDYCKKRFNENAKRS